MKKERTIVKVSSLQNNEGQIQWLPKNPRQWTEADLKKTQESLKRDPDFLEDRPLLITPEMVVFAGNLRLTAARKLRLKEVPAIIYTPETEEDYETIKRRTILDNGSFGAWDYDALANEWDDLALADWGVPAWNNGDEELPPSDLDAEPKEKPFVCKITFPDAEKMTAFVTAYKDVLEQDYGCTISESGGEL